MPTRLLSIFGIGMLFLFLAACGGSDDSDSPPASAAPPPGGAPAAAAPTEVALPEPTSSATSVEVKLEDVGGSGKYRFNPDELTFSVGDELTLVLTSETEFHTFTVKDLDIDVAVDAGKSESLTFKFDTPGTYELICIPHQSLGMRGAITVE